MSQSLFLVSAPHGTRWRRPSRSARHPRRRPHVAHCGLCVAHCRLHVAQCGLDAIHYGLCATDAATGAKCWSNGCLTTTAHTMCAAAAGAAHAVDGRRGRAHDVARAEETAAACAWWANVVALTLEPVAKRANVRRGPHSWGRPHSRRRPDVRRRSDARLRRPDARRRRADVR